MSDTRQGCAKRTWCALAADHGGACVVLPPGDHQPTNFGPKATRAGRKTRARMVLEMLNLAVAEIDAAAVEATLARAKERMQLASRLIADAVVSVNRWEANG